MFKETQEMAEIIANVKSKTHGVTYQVGGGMAMQIASALIAVDYRKIDAQIWGQRKYTQEQEIYELAAFIGDHNIKKGSIDERYLPYVSEVARSIVKNAGFRKAGSVQQETAEDMLKEFENRYAPLKDYDMATYIEMRGFIKGFFLSKGAEVE